MAQFRPKVTKLITKLKRQAKRCQTKPDKGLNRVERAVQSAEFAQHRSKRTACIDITHKPVGGSKNPTVRAKEKLKRSVRELI